MVGQTDSTTYQIWQGREGNHTRFINHSCHPNSEYERFVWLGTQRIVLVSKGVRAEEEITVDYSDVYWQVSNIAGLAVDWEADCMCRISTKSAYAGMLSADTTSGVGSCLLLPRQPSPQVQSWCL